MVFLISRLLPITLYCNTTNLNIWTHTFDSLAIWLTYTSNASISPGGNVKHYSLLQPSIHGKIHYDPSLQHILNYLAPSCSQSPFHSKLSSYPSYHSITPAPTKPPDCWLKPDFGVVQPPPRSHTDPARSHPSMHPTVNSRHVEVSGADQRVWVRL